MSRLERIASDPGVCQGHGLDQPTVHGLIPRADPGSRQVQGDPARWGRSSYDRADRCVTAQIASAAAPGRGTTAQWLPDSRSEEAS